MFRVLLLFVNGQIPFCLVMVFLFEQNKHTIAWPRNQQ